MTFFFFFGSIQFRPTTRPALRAQDQAALLLSDGLQEATKLNEQIQVAISFDISLES